MCLAVPMELVEKEGFRGVARLGDVSREVNLMLMPEAEIGDYVVIHAGCAISRVSPDEAKRTLDMLRQIKGFGDIGA